MGNAYFNFDCGDKPSNARGSKAEALTYWMNVTRAYQDRMKVFRDFVKDFKFKGSEFEKERTIPKMTREEKQAADARTRRKRYYPKIFR